MGFISVFPRFECGDVAEFFPQAAFLPVDGGRGDDGDLYVKIARGVFLRQAVAFHAKLVTGRGAGWDLDLNGFPAGDTKGDGGTQDRLPRGKGKIAMDVMPTHTEIGMRGEADAEVKVAVGSAAGTLPAMSVLETGWRENMDEEEAKKLVRSVKTPFNSLFRIRKIRSP